MSQRRVGPAQWAMIAPVQALLLGVIFVPALYVFWLSLNKSSFGVAPSFVGLANFVTYFSTPALLDSALNSGKVAAFCTLVVVPLAFVYAYALTRAVLERTGGIGVDHAFVCIDPPATLLPAFRATTKGGNVVVTALTPDTVTEIRIPPLELFATQKAVMGAVYGFASPRLQIPELLGLYRKGDLKLRELITRTYRLDEINRGYADLDAGKNLRGVVVFD